jgi:PAS domain S-box-containing protein
LNSTAIDPKDAAAGVVFTALDITERKAAEAQRDAMLAALQESEERHRQLFELESDAILLIDNETGRILEINAAAGDLYGYSRDELLDKKHTDLSAEPDQTRRATHDKSVWVPVRFHRKKDGSIFPVEITARHFNWRGRQVHIAAVRDITQRVLAEEGLRRRNRELTMLNQIIAASASGLEMEAVLETACRELAQTFGAPGALAILHNEEQTRAMVVAEYGSDSWPRGLNMAIPIEGNPLLQDLIVHKMPLLAGNAQGQAPQPAPLEHLGQRGINALLMLPLVVEGTVAGSLCLGASEPRHFSAEEISLAWNVAGQVAGVLAQVRLNQQRRQLEAQYYQAQKMEAVGQLTAGIAHEFNNLLTAINGYAELVQLQLMPGDPLRDMVERVQNSGRRAAGLVRQLLAFSRRQVMEPRVVSLNEVVSDMGRMLQRIIGENIELVTVLAPDVWPVKVDPAQIEQVVVNLAINARDALPVGGRLCIETANVVLDADYAASHLEVQAGDYVLLAVSDTGVGMDERIKARLFEPFFTTKDVGQGTGLGLSVVYGVVRQSGGHIDVYSQEGAGTTFKIYLPRAKEVLQPAVPRWGMAEIPVGQETILLVATDESVRDLARRLLRGQGYTVLEARNGQEALLVSAHHSGPVHLLLTDMVMPGLSGKALADELAQARPELKILFSLGYADLGIDQHDSLEPSVAFLRKPFSPMTLALRVRQVLDRK